MVDTTRALGAGAIWSMLDNLAQQALSFLVFIVLARLIAPEEFGLIAVAHLVVTFLRQTVLDAIVHPVARSEAPTDALYSYAFGICVVASTLMCALMLGSATVIARFYAQPELMKVLSWMSLVLLATGMAAVYEARLVRQMQFRPLAIRSIVSVTVGGGVGILLAVQGAGVMALVAQQVLTSGIALALLVAQSRWHPRWPGKSVRLHMFSSSSWRVGLTGFFGFLTSQGDTVLVSIFMGAYATGIYSFAKRLTSAIYLVIGSSLLKLAIPAFAAAQNHPEALRESYVRILGMSVFLMAPMLAGLSVLAQPMISLLFGPVWEPAVPIIALLSVLYLLLAANQINDYLMFAVGAHSAPMQRTLLQIVIALALGWLMSSRGLPWIASGFVLAGVLVWPWAQWRANGYMRFGFLKLALALRAPVIATAAMLLFLFLLVTNAPLTALALTGEVAFGVIVFLAVHALVTKTSPGAYNALAELMRLLRPRAA